jgi:hypothetical protein
MNKLIVDLDETLNFANTGSYVNELLDMVLIKYMRIHDGFYIDDRVIRRSKFNSTNFAEVTALIEKDKLCS